MVGFSSRNRRNATLVGMRRPTNGPNLGNWLGCLARIGYDATYGKFLKTFQATSLFSISLSLSLSLSLSEFPTLQNNFEIFFKQFDCAQKRSLKNWDLMKINFSSLLNGILVLGIFLNGPTPVSFLFLFVLFKNKFSRKYCI